MSICKKCDKSFTPKKGLINYCSLQCRNSRKFSDESRTKKSLSNKNQIPWNKNKKTKWVISKCKYCKKDIHHLLSNPKKYHPECWLKCSGGYREGSGIGKKGWYKGFWCDSSYELVWVIYNLEHGFKFERNKKTYIYVWKNKKRKYCPDFIKDNKIYEIKGYVDSQTEEKLKVVPNLIVLFKKDLTHEFEYVIKKYGKDFIKLYENH